VKNVSPIKSKLKRGYKITIPKSIREALNIKENSELEWRVEDQKIIIEPIKGDLMKLQSIIKIGAGDIDTDIEEARKKIAKNAI